jgi:hypothetical protein
MQHLTETAQQEIESAKQRVAAGAVDEGFDALN